MDIEHRIKDLKHLRPDAAYARRSRALIVGDFGDEMKAAPHGLWQMILNSMEFGTAVALAGALLVLVLGGFSTWQFLSPFNLASLDPAGLRVEAQAVDIQIQLTDLEFVHEAGESTPAVAPGESTSAGTAVKQLAKNLGIDEKTASGEEEPPSIDDVLGTLAE